ncbi:MAG TPA: hypothetical protein VL200_10295 [Lacunisphaera sp.]|nr:hypothetical protein [Lacunisphaera sp.]
MGDAIEIIWAEPILTEVIRELVRPRDLARFVPTACAEVLSLQRARGRRSPTRTVARYLADGTIEAGVEVREVAPADPRLLRSHLPAGWAAHAVHRGTYDRLGMTHRAIQNWCAAHGHHTGGERWEIYSPWQAAWDADPQAIRTDVFHVLTPDIRGAAPTPTSACARPEDVAREFVRPAGAAGISARVIESVHLVE